MNGNQSSWKTEDMGFGQGQNQGEPPWKLTLWDLRRKCRLVHTNLGGKMPSLSLSFDCKALKYQTFNIFSAMGIAIK